MALHQLVAVQRAPREQMEDQHFGDAVEKSWIDFR